jgi:hypothetical protein
MNDRRKAALGALLAATLLAAPAGRAADEFALLHKPLREGANVTTLENAGSCMAVRGRMALRCDLRRRTVCSASSSLPTIPPP